jgi:4a-hydroxytetrahydrobiopterin dehydratase
MTEALASKTCTPCRGGIPPLTLEQAEIFHAEAPDWQLPEEANRIERSFRFRNFREALTFVQEIGELAEAEGHHPNISFGWGNATVSLQTKKIKGLHEPENRVSSHCTATWGMDVAQSFIDRRTHYWDCPNIRAV